MITTHSTRLLHGTLSASSSKARSQVCRTPVVSKLCCSHPFLIKQHFHTKPCLGGRKTGQEVHPQCTQHEEQHGNRAAVAAFLAASCLALAAPALANGTAELFASTCAGCHIGGGNIVRRDATLKLADLQKQGLTEPGVVYDVIYNGRGQMPGYGLECAPKLRCTFAKRLTDDEIRGLAAYVLEQAAADWPAAGN